MTSSFWARSAAKSMSTSAGATPGKRGWRASHTVRAASRRFLEGRQPRLTQVPPIVRRSAMATFAPSSLARMAAAKAVAPEPMMNRSASAIGRLLRAADDGLRRSPLGQLPIKRGQPPVQVAQLADPALDLGPLLAG